MHLTTILTTDGREYAYTADPTQALESFLNIYKGYTLESVQALFYRVLPRIEV